VYDLVGDADVDAALGVALDIGSATTRNDPARRRFAIIERFLGAGNRLVGAAVHSAGTLTAPIDAVTETGPDFGSAPHLIANAGKKPLGRYIYIIDGAILQDQAEFVAGKTDPNTVAAAQPRANPPGPLPKSPRPPHRSRRRR